ncbi:EscU/YscU/HrcU family type III secretion system export apparatus switch protein [Sulfitobacter donghicola]|uniref:Flagellar biosynthesis protein FlhB n=1 Tax=Sulfitobacter donghicola DSW-25 = KCTC 12864 = JCM 14565 TaxID=1300350 RepID=A0A073IYV1_9RHOB|nr:flagellar type III secretion system protein FlhB [Sulfitobacter donghicola]KEJ90547.1 flagellar biosynthesis protein FlhB [Sulfitobacter donghicola DSW-25 = KCTC 12864 = JCM 14565]KIN67791.1 Flagellar biosynthetic protein FlhB [Sulfitobacter donghicola DSW-25 = KCTC 12864 = JCM 14565]
MSDGEDPSDKSFDASPQKLLEARKKGDIAKSNDLLTASAYFGLFIAFSTVGSSALREAGSALMIFIDQPDSLANMFISDGTNGSVNKILRAIAWALVPLFLLPAIAVILAMFAQNAWVFAPNKLQPKLNRISVLSNAKNKFGRDGLFEFFKSFIKLIIFSICLALFIQVWLSEMVASLQTTPQASIMLLANICITFLGVVVLVSGAIGGVDALWQHASHMRKNKMSRKEMTDEAKNNEGDPHMKQERRQRALLASQSQMMKDVPAADVIIVNPTHYAVALKWDRQSGAAPTCVAKGVDEIAATIRRLAAEAGVPIHSDPPTARALHAAIEIGEQIRHEDYAAVAVAIRFAEDMRRRAKGTI